MKDEHFVGITHLEQSEFVKPPAIIQSILSISPEDHRLTTLDVLSVEYTSEC